MTAAIDHLVVGAATLDQGVAWCERTLGITPGPGGKHPLMGTHNRLFGIAGAAHPLTYFEIIAIDPAAPHPGRIRWFDLDDPVVQARLAQAPQLLHWVVRVDDVAGAVQDWQALGIARGQVLAAERPSPSGMLRWRITVRDDGQRLMNGALPTLIQWDGTHPAQAMPASGVSLQRLHLCVPQPPLLHSALAAIGLDGVSVEPAGAPSGSLRAVLQTPRGRVELVSAEAA